LLEKDGVRSCFFSISEEKNWGLLKGSFIQSYFANLKQKNNKKTILNNQSTIKPSSLQPQ
jgi:hypothetical protein